MSSGRSRRDDRKGGGGGGGRGRENGGGRMIERMEGEPRGGRYRYNCFMCN